MTQVEHIPDQRQSQVASLSQVEADTVKAEMVRMHQSTADILHAESVDLNQKSGGQCLNSHGYPRGVDRRCGRRIIRRHPEVAGSSRIRPE